jgi:hypothetical protein
MNLTDFKAKMGNAFKAMRTEGLVARQTFSCCRSCAGFELATNLKAKTQAEKEACKGCAFYTKQDAPPREDSRDFRFFEGLYISYGPLGVSGEKDYGLPTEEVGAIVKRCLEKEGLEVEWDGSPEARIFVRFPRNRA